MRINFLIFIMFFSLKLFAQKEIKIVKIDNSNFPETEIIIKGINLIDTSKLLIFENKKRLDYITYEVPLNDLKKERRILFLVNNFNNESIRKLLLKELKKLKKTDLINIGIILKTKKDRETIYYLSPEFSNKRSFFKNYLEQKTISIFPKETCKYQEDIQKELFSDDSYLKNTGIIIIGNLQNKTLNFCSDFQNNTSSPIYILQTKTLKKEKEDTLIKICMNSGGMYTQSKSENDRIKILNRYTEDIFLDPINSKSNLLKIRFNIKNTNKETEIKISYSGFSQSLFINKPTPKKLSRKELILTIFSSVLLLIIIFFMYRCRKNKKEKNIETENDIKLQPINITIPIEINIKGKGLNKTYFFEKHLIRIGRNKDNDIVIPDTTVSGNHAIINKQGKEFTIQDLGSTNGVIVNKKKIKKQVLKTGDQIKLGGVVMFVRF